MKARAVAVALVFLASPSGAESVDGLVPLFGSLHAHSTLSGDVSAGKGLEPRAAFEFAKTAGLDFLGISDHHKHVDAPGADKYHLDESVYVGQLFEVAMSFSEEHAGEFVAIPGIEWGTIATGNHVNIFGAPRLPPPEIRDEDYDELYLWALDHARLVQLNHPYSWRAKGSARNRDVGNYGRALFENDAAFVSALDPVASLMSIVCTVRGGHISGEHHDSVLKTHRDHHPEAFREYLRHLNLGFHLSPAANQDTHGKNPGAVTAARTGVWAASRTYEDILAGLRASRVFATEDDELAVALQVRVGEEVFWMGSVAPIPREEADVELIVTIQQQGSQDETGEGPYEVIVYSDADGYGGQTAAEWDTFQAEAGTTTFTVPVVGGEYLFLEVLETGGKDNPIGDGEDTELPRGERDDLNDSAWTSPLWFTYDPNAGQFVWSKNSRLYHDENCWAAQRIGAANRQQGPRPTARQPHDCTH